MKKLLRITAWLLAGGLALVLAAWTAFQVSPWPAVLLIRRAFDAGAKSASDGLVKHLPTDVMARLNETYDRDSPHGKLDVFFPAAVEGTDRRLTAVVWIHGGGFVSGRKEDIGNYGRILAGRGFVVLAVDYTIAPEAQYPTPVRQVNTALAWLVRNADRLHIDPTRIVLAGDSAGSHIASQLANAIAVPAYARALGLEPGITRRQLAGVVLHCGVYGADHLNFDGPFGGFLRTALWSYFGTRDFLSDLRLEQFSIARHLTSDFPPAFISAGNGDPLLPQSRALAAALKEKGVVVDELFFPDNYAPALPHEYQFSLDSPAGVLALDRSVAFLQTLGAPEPQR